MIALAMTIRAGLRWVILALVVLPTASAVWAQPVVSSAAMDTSSLGAGRYSHMWMLLEKTIFQVDVLTLDVRFGVEDTRRIERLAAGRRHSRDLEEAIAQIAIHTRDAYMTIEFRREVSLEQFVDGVREDLGRVPKAGIISQADYEEISANLPIWFAFLEERRIWKGDRIEYRVRGDSLRTRFVSRDGEVLLDQVDAGESPRLAVLGSYFVRGSSFRKELIESLFRDER